MTITSSHPLHVAVIKPCCIGDVVMALPAIDALAGAWPTATIDIYIGTHTQPLLAVRPTLQTQTLPDTMNMQAALTLGRKLRNGQYDAVVALDRSRWIRLAVRMSRIPLRAHLEPIDPEIRHESEVYLDTVRAIGIATPTTTPMIAVTSSASVNANALLNGDSGPFVVLHPGGAQNPGTTMLDKRWPAQRFVELARALRGGGLHVFLSGSMGDRALVEAIARQAGLEESACLAGRLDLPTLAAVLERATAFVGPDTGVSHIAAAVGTPTIAIFGPTNPRRYRPIGAKVVVLATAASWEIPDRDLRHGNALLGDMPSTEAISVQMVLDAVAKITLHGRGEQ